MKLFSTILAIGLLSGCAKAPCACNPCTCPADKCECTPDECKCPKAQTIVKPIDDSGKGYVTVIVAPGYEGWATKWADAKIKRENHYTVLLTSSPLYKERFAKAVPHAPCILLQKANGAIVDRIYDSKAAKCCPWKKWKKEEEKQEEKAAPVPDEEEAEIEKEEANPGPWLLLGLLGAVAGTAAAWHFRKTTPSKKS